MVATSVHRAGRTGYTLLEMILVLAVLVAAAGALLINVMAMPDVNRLSRAADEVRGVLTGLRARAMEEGLFLEWTFQPDSPSYSVKRPGDGGGVGQGSAPQWLDASPGNQVNVDSDRIFGDHQLPEGVTFRIGNSQTSGSIRPNTVRFQQDGTANSLEFLVDDGLAAYRFQVRSLTGAVTVRKVASGGKRAG